MRIFEIVKNGDIELGRIELDPNSIIVANSKIYQNGKELKCLIEIQS